MGKKCIFLVIFFVGISAVTYCRAESPCVNEKSVPLFKPEGWGKVIPSSEGQLIYCKEPGKEFRGKIIVKGLDPNHYFKLSLYDKKPPAFGSGNLPYHSNSETYFDFQDIKTDKEGNCEIRFSTEDDRLPDGIYDVKFFLKDWELKSKPVVLYNDNIFFTINK
jgi:hypothetical protein